MRFFQVLALVGTSPLCIPPVFALLPYFMNYLENDVKGMIIDDAGMFQSAVPQLRTAIVPLLKRAGNCAAGDYLCGDNCISTSYTCCIDTRTNTRKYHRVPFIRQIDYRIPHSFRMVHNAQSYLLP